jgi:hypothetical protein
MYIDSGCFKSWVLRKERVKEMYIDSGCFKSWVLRKEYGPRG